MIELDGDDGHLKDSSGTQAVRDIVQFVKFNSYADDLSKLHEHVLKEVPKQFLSYMRMNGILPKSFSGLKEDDD